MTKWSSDTIMEQVIFFDEDGLEYCLECAEEKLLHSAHELRVGEPSVCVDCGKITGTFSETYDDFNDDDDDDFLIYI